MYGEPVFNKAVLTGNTTPEVLLIAVVSTVLLVYVLPALSVIVTLAPAKSQSVNPAG